ncbi:MAG: hypothetical protein GTO60_16545 [Gammaproteobacteria bacterium]|nr:hypothetical protein [Gammaproteobacteria bacterium]
MREQKHFVSLTDDEILLLDGRCDERIQKKIDIVKMQQRYNIAAPDEYKPIIARILEKAERTGILSYSRGRHVRRCDACDKAAGYATYTRTTKYHRKGDPNFNRPLAFYAHSIAGFEICNDCFSRLEQHLLRNLDGIQAEVSHHLTGHSSALLCFTNVICNECQWAGHEGELKSLPVAFGGDAKCPRCGSTNQQIIGGKVARVYGQFTLIPNPKYQEPTS